MSFDETMNAHTKRKVRLWMAISGSEKLDENEVRKEDQSELGKWI